jgi:hypothetical protein
MRGLKRGCWLVSMVFAVLLRVAAAQGVTTTVQDTVYRADGTPAGGTVLVSWGAFTTAGGDSIPAGSTSVTLGTGGALSVALAPNAGATPMGSYYTAVFHLNDGTTSKEYWVVPVAVPGGGPAKLAAIENQVLPTSVAMQTVSKQYVDGAISQAITGYPKDNSPYVEKVGDTMTGPLVLPADPVSPNQAADKNYVDENVASISGGLAQKVSLFPAATQAVAQPTGTELDVNLLNGELHASQYVSGGGNNGVANALASPDCAHGCRVVADATYTGTDTANPTQTNLGVAVVDERGGAESRGFYNPLGVTESALVGESIATQATMSVPELNVVRPGTLGLGSTALALGTQALAGGNNQDPVNIESVPYAKSTYGVLSMQGNYNTQGQHIQAGNVVDCYSVGDCLAGGQFIFASGGYRDPSDEGTHPFDLQVAEDFQTYTGTCLSGCTTGSTTVVVNGSNTLGDGRFLIDKNPAKVINSGSLIGGNKSIFGTANFSGTSFPVSVFLATAQAATSQPANMAPGTVTLPIATSGVTAGFATNTAALPSSSGVACVADGSTTFPEYEMANYMVVDGTHLQLTLNKPHGSGATIAVGGLCGYGLEQTVDTYGSIRQVFPVIGSTDATDLYYADALTSVVGAGIAQFSSTSGYLNVSMPVVSMVRSGNVVTATLASGMPKGDVNGLTLTVTGASDSSYNGSYVVSTTSGTTLTFANTGPDSTSTGGTMAYLTGGYVLYPMAEVLSVFNPATRSMDGTLTLAANTVPWGTGDVLEEPHYYQQQTFADTESITQYVPRPEQFASAGKQYDGEVGPGVRGWVINNDVPQNNYIGAGGTHRVPDVAYGVLGAWAEDFDVEAGTGSVIHAHCNLYGCNRWDSAYDVFLLDSAAGSDFLNYSPQTSTFMLFARGVGYTFSPSGFSAGTINVGTLNAGTITGGVSGGSINSGTVSAAFLPLFGPSGTTHAPGIVPDPGATAGATRYLREDGTWAVPAGGSGGSPSGAAGGDLSGTYPNPTVAAVHATSGTLNGVTLGATTPAAASVTTLSMTGAITQIVPGAGDVVDTFSNSGTGAMYMNIGSTIPYAGFRTLDFSTGQGWQVGLFGSDDLAFLSTASGGVKVASIANGAPANSFKVNVDGSTTFLNNVSSTSYTGPATAPAGSCAASGQWVFSQDGHATFCASGTWVTKI